MKRNAIILAGTIGGLATVCTSLALNDGSNPYDGIAERNVFSLKPPAPTTPPEPPAAPAPKITLNGITSILGKSQVLFKIAPSKPGDKEQSYILSEGEAQDEIEVQTIDFSAGTVTFKNHGSVQTLSMDKDAAVAPTASTPAVPRPAGVAQPGRIGQSRAEDRSTAGQPELRRIPTRPTRGGNNSSSSRTGAAAPVIATPGGTAQQGSQQANPALSREEQVVLIEVDRELNKEKIATGEYPPLPPTELTPPGSTGVPNEAIPPSPGQ